MTTRSPGLPDLLGGVSPGDITLEEPDLERARLERRDRTRDAMEAMNPAVTRGILPKPDSRSPEDVAATLIQASYRGHLGRKLYVRQLYNKYQQEEAMRLEKQLQQVEEGQLLVDSHRLEVELDDNVTTRRNKTRHYLADIITIQRAWRRYRQNGYHQVATNSPVNGRYGDRSMSPDTPSDESDESYASTSSHSHQPMSVCSPDDDEDEDDDYHGNNRIERDPESTVSDYSEMSEPIKEHLANVQLIARQDAAVVGDIATVAIAREPDESDAEFARRVRKINYLSLAQEFAALQKMSAGTSPDTDDSEPEARPRADHRPLVAAAGDFDVYNIETTLPQMDWEMLEEQLHRAAEEEKMKAQTRRNDREEIRRKLAMGTEEDYYGPTERGAYKKPNLTTRLQGGMNLQLCFMNQTPTDAGHGLNAENHGGGAGSGRNSPESVATIDQTPVAPVTIDNVSPPATVPTATDEDLYTKQAKLQAEARMALAQVRPMAHMQLEVEKQMRKKSPIAEVVQNGIPGFGDGKRRRLRRQLLGQMNLAQLQVVVNDLHAQIEGLNEELVRMLVERDDLHMEQDSMLVDIEDLTRRTQETKIFPQS